MTPKRPPQETEKQPDMFRVELEDLVNLQHPLVRLADQIPWKQFEEAFDPLYCPEAGRPAIATRLMVGLHYLKHTYNLSDEGTVARWTENPYWQYFCGMKYFEYDVPIDPSSMTRWRKKIGEAGAEQMLSATVEAGLKQGVIKPKSFKRVIVDTTVQEKAVRYPTDSQLYHAMRKKLVAMAVEHGVALRQSYARLARKALLMASRYTHARQMKRARREIKKLKNYLGRVARDLERKMQGDKKKQEVFAQALALAARLLGQQRASKNKLYSIHAPEVECISKGKTHKKYEFGVKVGIVTTEKESFVIGMKAFPGNPYDAHTLAQSMENAEKITGGKLEGDALVDRGYRGHNYVGPATVHIVGMKKKEKPWRWWWKRRRAAIEPIIGHMKNDGRLGRNHLAGAEGDKINPILCGAGQNMRKLLREILFSRLMRRFCLLILHLLSRLLPVSPDFMPPSHSLIAA
jgi:transposase, IS5 family